MKQHEVAKLILDIERSMQMRTVLHHRLTTNQTADVVEEWKEIEQLDLEVVRKIRKRRMSRTCTNEWGQTVTGQKRE